MVTAITPEGRDKVVTKIPPQLRRELKIRAATVGVDIQDAVTEGIKAWKTAAKPLPTIDTSGAQSFSTYVPTDLLATFRGDCSELRVAYNQALAQSIRLWLDSHPLPGASGEQPGPAGSRSATRRAGSARLP